MKSIKNLILIVIFTYSCGFKVINVSELQNFYISSIETSGDKRIGYNLKNKLLLKTDDSTKENIELIIDVKKNKSVKEKNASNEITKYLINVNLDIKIKKNNKVINQLNISNEKDYNVDSQYSQTIVNENKAVKSITELLVAKLVREISLINSNDL
tara:strand:- start:25 stop:492 length:468 start_codon:yes stop_codon:yes gene_type:complete